MHTQQREVQKKYEQNGTRASAPSIAHSLSITTSFTNNAKRYIPDE